ncbi:MAG: hypothetical protein LYZ69_02725 [Nitrososphaerales archaeon]|nr:hypothetical protein [Nitrososphaerales archaeon]
MLSVRRRTYLVAGASLFAAIYSVLGLIPVSPYVGVSSFLTFREILSPLAGMLFGPVVGGFSMILGGFIDFGLGKPVIFDFLDFVPDLAAAVTAGLCFTGRRKAAVALPVLLMAVYSVDPLSAPFVSVVGVEVPFVWMHAASVLVLSVALLLQRNGKIGKLGLPFVAATVFASTMCGHVAGSLLYENILVRVNHAISPQVVQAAWPFIFYVYPAERILFTVLGTAVSVPVLRSLSRARRAQPTVA